VVKTETNNSTENRTPVCVGVDMDVGRVYLETLILESAVRQSGVCFEGWNTQ
jgi:hypothetical protein